MEGNRRRGGGRFSSHCALPPRLDKQTHFLSLALRPWLPTIARIEPRSCAHPHHSMTALPSLPRALVIASLAFAAAASHAKDITLLNVS